MSAPSTSQPDVSLVMANYNGAAHLPAALDSALGQSLRNIELILADDGSSDASLEIAGARAAADPRLVVLRAARNGGPAAARNRAFDAARGRWLAVFDSDDLMAPDRLERLVGAGEASGADIVVDNLLLFTEGQPGSDRRFLNTGRRAHWVGLADYINSSRMYGRRPNLGYLKPLFRSEALAGRRYREDLKIGEDYDLVVRLLAGGARLWLEREALYRYRKHPGSISARMNARHLQAMLAADAEALPDPGDPAVRRAQQRRTASLQAALAYDRVICALKARDLGTGLRQSLARPDIWPLLTMPVTARLRRLMRRGRLLSA